MKDRKILFTLLNVAIYTTGAAIVFAWLTIRASNGGLFSTAQGAFTTVVPAAPGIEPNKTEVLTEAGVTVGVVTGVERDPKGARIDIKITGPLKLRRDASTQVVVRNIIGERAIMVRSGRAGQYAASGQMLAWKDGDTINEPSEALEPLEDVQGARTNPELQRFANEQKDVLTKSKVEVEKIVADGKLLSQMLSTQKVALDNLGRRGGDLIDVLADKGPAIDSLLAQTAALAKEGEALLDDNLTVVEHGLDLAANTLQVVSRRQRELDYVMGRLPEIAGDLDHMTKVIIKLLRNERGYFIYVGVTNMPDLNKVLEILKEGS